MEILRWGRWESDVHVHICARVSSLEAVVRELRYGQPKRATAASTRANLQHALQARRRVLWASTIKAVRKK
jgi:hypothetical protein